MFFRTATARGKAEQADYAAVCANEDSTEVDNIDGDRDDNNDGDRDDNDDGDVDDNDHDDGQVHEQMSKKNQHTSFYAFFNIEDERTTSNQKWWQKVLKTSSSVVK